MPSSWRIALILLAVPAVLALQPASTVDAGHRTCTVASVVDGDTFDCTDSTRVRMLRSTP
jgi:endonuclease YncB( thermonuclease family)